MAIHINISKSLVSEKETVKIHRMPCTIKRNGEARVSKYFEPNISVNETGVLSTSFRGRPLLGKEIQVPENYSGVVLHEAHEMLDEAIERNIYLTGTFDKFTYWNHDKIPTSNDDISSAMDWIDISSALHSPIES